MQQGVRLAPPPDRHDERVGDELGRHGIAHRPAHHPAREQVDDSGHVKPPFGSPDVGEVCHPLLVGPAGRELAIQDIAGDDQAFALILWQTATTRACSQPLCLQEPFDPVQAARDALCQQVVPDTAGIVGAIATNMAGPDPGADHLIVTGTLRRRPGKPGMESTSRDTERPAHPCHRPDPSVLRDEGEPHIESFAK